MYKSYNQLRQQKVQEYELLSVQNRDHRAQLLKDNGVVCIDVWAEWCKPCRDCMPTVAAMAQKYAGFCLFAKEELNIELSKEYDLQTVPCFLIFVNKQLFRKIEGFNQEEIEKAINDVSQMSQQPISAPTKTYTTTGNPYKGGNPLYRQNYGQEPNPDSY